MAVLTYDSDESRDPSAEAALPEEESVEQNEAELNAMIENLCLSKAQEFVLLGYGQVTGKDIWDCVSDKYAKKGYPQLHQIVNDILSLKSTQFMNWMTMRMYRGDPF